MKKAACIALGLGFALAASAAEPAVGSIQDVKGAVTVSSTQAVKRAANGCTVAFPTHLGCFGATYLKR